MFKVKKIRKFVNWLYSRTSWGQRISLALLAVGVVGALGGGLAYVHGVGNQGDQGNGEGAPVTPPSSPPPAAPPAGTTWSIEAAYEVSQADSEVPGGLFSETFAGKVASDDKQYFTTSRSTLDKGWDGQVYKFKISTPAGGAGYSSITVHWTGFGEPTEGYPVRIELYNQSTHLWQMQRTVQTEALGENVSLDLDLVDNFNSYVASDGTLWVRVRADNVQLDPPENLEGYAAASNEVRLSWSDRSSGESGFSIERSQSGTGAWESVATVPADTPVYTDYDSGLQASKTYLYRVKAVAGSAESDPATSDPIATPSSGHRSGATINVPSDAASIQEALNLAQQNDTIQVAAGTYSESVVVRTPKVTLSGAGVSQTTIDVPSSCRGEYCSAVALATNSQDPVTVQGMTLQNGTGTLVEGRRYGGGVIIQAAAATLRRLAIMRNFLAGSNSDGAAIAMLDPLAVTVDNVVGMLNISSGAGVYIRGSEKGVVLRHVTLANGGTEGHDPAAGFWAEKSPSSLDIVNSIIWTNSSGGAYAEVASDMDSHVVSIDHSNVGPKTTVGGTSGSGSSASQQNSSNADPLLVAMDDPHLQGTSPAIDAADSAAATSYDYENGTRPSGSGYDRGAAEYHSAAAGGGSSGGGATTGGGGKKTDRGSIPFARELEAPKFLHASLNTDYISLEISDVTPPVAPSGLNVLSVGNDRVVLSWTDNSSDEEGFIVHRIDASGEVALAPIASHSGPGTVVFPDYGADLPTGRLFPGTEYCYYVVAYRGSATAASDQTDPCPITTGTLGDVPRPPSNVAVAGVSAGQVRVSWTDNSSDEEGFVLYRRKQGSSDGYTIVNPPAVANATTYVDWGGDTPEGVLQSGATYCYQVASYNVNGLSARVPASDNACAATLLQTWVEVYEGGGDDTKAPTLSDLGQINDRRFGGENDNVELETRLAELFDEENVYNWQVFAIHLDTAPAGLSSLAVRWRGRGESMPNYPVRFSFYNFAENKWEHQRVFNGGHDEEGDVRGDDDGHGANPSGGNQLFNFSFTSAQLASTYAHRVGSYDNTVLLWVRGRAHIDVPDAPENLRAAPDPTPNNVYLQWEDRSSNETNFQIQRADPAPAGPVPLEPNWSLVGTVAANITTYIEYVPVASDFRYRVRAVRNSIGSPYTPEVRVTPPLFPPYLPNVVPLGSDSIQVNWQLNPLNRAVFPNSAYTTEVYRALGMNPMPIDWVKVGTVSNGATTYADPGLSPDTTYSYRLRFTVAVGGVSRESQYSEAIYTKTTPIAAPAAPQNLKADVASASQINLSWDDVANETSYALERQNGLTGTWQTVTAAIGANVVSYGDAGLIAGQLYQYRIRAANSSGYSEYSNVVAATTLPASGEEWAQSSTLPAWSGLEQGAAVLTSHAGYLYAASNDAAGQGAEEWQHLNIWRSTDGGKSDPWHWVGKTSNGVANNVPVAMVSFNGGLFLLTGSSLWTSVNDGGTWNQTVTKGVGDASSQGFFSHMTVYSSRLYVLFGDGSLQSTASAAGSWTVHSVPTGLQGLGQFNGFLLAYREVTPLVDTDPTTAQVYRTSNGSLWTLIGTVPGQDAFGRCDDFNGLMGLGTYLFSGAQDRVTHEPCLRVSANGGASWSRTGGYLNIWSALPGTSAYIASTAYTPDVVAGRIQSSNGLVVVVPVSGLSSGYVLWSLASHSGHRYAAAYRAHSLNPVNPPPTAILELR